MEAPQTSLIFPGSGWLYARLGGAVGDWVSPPAGPYASNSDNWAAGQAELAVKSSRS